MLLGAALLAGACSRPAAPPPTKNVIIWNTLGSWAGRGNAQTESFVSDTGALRITWETSKGTGSPDDRFRLTVFSSISGRPLLTAIDFQGVGRDTAYVTEDPRPFYATVESSGVDWKFTVDEAIPATVTEKPEN